MEHVCVKTEVISDMKERMETLEKHDREDFGSRKELELSIKMLSESIKEQSKTSTEVSKTLSKINANMDLMTIEIQNTNNRVEKLEVKLSKNDDDNTIRVMPLIKNVVLRILFPTTAIGFVFYELAKALNIIKIGD